MTTKPDLHPTPVLRRAQLEQITASMTKALDGEFSDLNDDARKRLLENVEDLLETTFRLCNGITIQKFETDRKTGEVDEVIYTTPPFWPAIKYLLEWFRGIAESSQSGEGRGIDDPEVAAFLKGFMAAAPPEIERGDVEDRDGVRHLGAYRITEEEPDDESPTDD